MPVNLSVTRTGRMISGAFIGTDEFIQDGLAPSRKTCRKLDKISSLGKLQPQIAIRLIKHVIITAMVYSCRVTDRNPRRSRLDILSDPQSLDPSPRAAST